MSKLTSHYFWWCLDISSFFITAPHDNFSLQKLYVYWHRLSCINQSSALECHPRKRATDIEASIPHIPSTHKTQSYDWYVSHRHRRRKGSSSHHPQRQQESHPMHCSTSSKPAQWGPLNPVWGFQSREACMLPASWESLHHGRARLSRQGHLIHGPFYPFPALYAKRCGTDAQRGLQSACPRRMSILISFRQGHSARHDAISRPFHLWCLEIGPSLVCCVCRCWRKSGPRHGHGNFCYQHLRKRPNSDRSRKGSIERRVCLCVALR